MAQKVAFKTNAFCLATSTPNVGIDVKLNDRWSLSFHGEYNPFLFKQWQDAEGNTYNPKIIHWLVMPEAKYWFCKSFERSNIGVHAIYGSFNIGAIPFIPRLKYDRYFGSFYGGGLSYGYQLALGRRWGVEFSLGVGYLYIQYKRCNAWICGEELEAARLHYIGPTKLAISFSYYIH